MEYIYKIRLKKKLQGANQQLDLDVDFEVEKGKVLGIMGESGTGKTSILRMIAGLLKPDFGKIHLENTWFDSQQKIDLLTQKRKVGFMFQEYALFPNMTVLQNLQFALLKSESSEFVQEMMQLMGLEVLEKSYPKNLSGGQKQRVALARALIRKPQILLLDEPLAALNRDMRHRLQEDLKNLQQKFQLTTILVSHDPIEIAKLADEILILEEGKIVQQGKPSTVLAPKDHLIKGKILDINYELNELTLLSEESILRIPLESEQIQLLKVGELIRFDFKRNRILKAWGTEIL